MYGVQAYPLGPVPMTDLVFRPMLRNTSNFIESQKPWPQCRAKAELGAAGARGQPCPVRRHAILLRWGGSAGISQEVKWTLGTAQGVPLGLGTAT